MDMTHIPEKDLIECMKSIRSEVLRLTGIPVSIGVAPNKTLAKLMNYKAKNNSKLNGVCSYYDSSNIDDIEIDEVWGIGYKWKKKLNNMGIDYIGQFKELPSYQVRKMFTIVGLRTWSELHGEMIYKIETKFKKPKVVTSSRSFGRTVWQREQVSDAICTFIEDGCNKMKSERLKGRNCIIFVTTNRFEEDYFVWSKKIKLYNPTNEVQSIWNELSPHLDELPIKLWAKAGIIFSDLIDDGVTIKTLFEENYENKPLPNIENKMWMTRRDFLSPKWTTDWSEIPKLS